MKLISILLGRSRPLLVLAMVVGAVSGAASTGLLAAINWALSEPRDLGSIFFGLFFGLCAFVSLARVLSVWLLQRLGQGTVLELRMELSRRLLATPLRHLEELGPHRLLTILTNDIGTLSGVIVLVPVLVINGTIVLGCLTYLAWLSPVLFAAFLALFALGVVTYRLPLAAGSRRFERVRRIQEDLFNHFRGLTDGVKELKLHGGRRGGFLGSLEETADAQRKLQIGANLIFAAAGAWGHLLLFVVVGGLLAVWPRLGGVEHGQLVSYVVVVIYVMTPLQFFLNSLPQLSQANASVARIHELGLSLDPTPEPLTASAAPAADWGELRLAGVTHSYRGASASETFTLGPVDLAFRPGEVVILAGGNGSGKTTLAKLVLGLYEPETGDVLLDGRRVDDGNREAYRGHFSAVFSDCFLFEQLFGLDGDGHVTLDEKARYYLERLQLHHKVEVEDGRLSTVDLSQGQRKRLALLAAYLEDRPIYLFDEWAADQDPVFKRIFYHALLPELRQRGKTVLAISHDEQYYGVADRVVKLDYGKVESDSRPVPEAVASHAVS